MKVSIPSSSIYKNLLQNAKRACQEKLWKKKKKKEEAIIDQ
jgi:hypothetical protein